MWQINEFGENLLKNYLKMTKKELIKTKNSLYKKYKKLKSLNLNLDMSRGKPCREQLDLSNEMLDLVNSKYDFSLNKEDLDVRNYGTLGGLPKLRRLFSKIMKVPSENVFIGGNSSLSLLFDAINCFFGYNKIEKKIKFLCPSPGYDRHFSICEYFNIDMIPVKMQENGPDMDYIENMVADEEDIAGILCVPKYSNPTGITYSDDTVKRLAQLRPRCKNFRIFWDMAYALHSLDGKYVPLLSLYGECKKSGTLENIIYFSSTSKITFAGGGVSAFAAFGKTFDKLKKMYSIKTIGFDKINQLRHLIFFKNMTNLKNHMQKHRKILWPKFELVLDKLNKEFKKNPIISWNNPKGGYFISVESFGSAIRIHELCKGAGLKITPAGATFPYGYDLNDSNIRLAPSFPEISELEKAIEIFSICVKISAIEKLLTMKN